MEYENGENFTDFDAEYTSSTPTYHVFHDILLILFLIVAICANIVIVYIILRFKQMRTVDNMFLANWAIADICSLIITPSGYAIIYTLDYFSAFHYSRCVFFHIAATLQATTVFFVILLTIDWFLATFFEKASQIFRTFYKYIIGAIWVISLLFSGFSSGYCLADEYTFFPSFTLFIGFCILIFIIVVLQITRGVRKYLSKPIESSTLMLTLPTSFLVCWLSCFFLFIVIDAARLHPVMALIAEAAIFGSSIVTLGLLYRLNTDFQSCFIQVLKRSPKDDDRICSFDNPIVRNMNNINHKDSIQITFDDPKDELLSNAY